MIDKLCKHTLTITMGKMEKRILIADDHGVVRWGLSMIIKKLRPDFIIDEVEDYEEVMSIIKEKKFDLAILDLNMPNGNFSETLHTIKTNYPHTKVMIFSCQDENLFAVRYLKMGADGFLHKLSDEKEINKALIMMLDKGSYISKEIKSSLVFGQLGKQEAPKNPLEVLSDREMEIAERLISGDAIKKISYDLNIHPSTVSTHKARIFQKLTVQSVPEMIKIFDFHEISRD